jgi:hypothetical protein
MRYAIFDKKGKILHIAGPFYTNLNEEELKKLISETLFEDCIISQGEFFSFRLLVENTKCCSTD